MKTSFELLLMRQETDPMTEKFLVSAGCDRLYIVQTDYHRIDEVLNELDQLVTVNDAILFMGVSATALAYRSFCYPCVVLRLRSELSMPSESSVSNDYSCIDIDYLEWATLLQHTKCVITIK